MCWRSPARTARRPPRRCWPGSWSAPAWRRASWSAACRSISACRRGWADEAAAPFVIEADEYDTAFFDKRSKFVHYRPRTAILNNLEFDHADIFDDLAAIERQFHHLVRTVPGTGRVVVNATEESLQRVLAQGCWSELARFGARRRMAGATARTTPSTCCAHGEPCRPRRMGAVRRAQPDERAGGHRRGRARGRRAGRGGRRAGRLPQRAPAHGTARHGGRATAARSRSTTTSPTTPPRSAPRSTACAASSTPKARKASASWRSSSRAATP